LGQSIVATSQAFPGVEFVGRIAAVDNRVDETTRTLRLEAELTNEGGMLKSGMAIRVVLHFETEEELSVPSLAVQWDRRGSYVWKVEDGVARRAEVTILRRQSGIVIVQGAVAVGDRVVVEGTQRLREGAKVAEVDETPAMLGAEKPAQGDAPAENAPALGGSGAPLGLRS
jgi:RND family efflux transporter MFP subunit